MLPEETARTTPDPPARGARFVLELLCVTLTTGIMSILWMFPKGFRGDSLILGHYDGDVVKHYWNLWWFHRMALHEKQLPYVTDYLNYPEGFRLYPIEPLNGLAILFLEGPLGLPWATNLLNVINLTLAGVGMFALVKFLSGRFWPALWAALFYALSAYALWTVYVGVGELSHLGWMPMAILFLLKVAKTPSWRNVIPAILFFFLTAFACWYYALFLYLIAFLLMLTDPWRRGAGLRLWARYATVLGVSLAMLLPIQRSFDVSYRAAPHSPEGLLEYVSRRIDASPHDSPSTRLDLPRMLIGGKSVRMETIQNPYGAGRFIGISVLLIALLALALRPGIASRFWLVFLVMAGLGMGARAVFNKVEVGPPLPFAVFNLALEWFSQPMNFPVRFVMPATLAAAVLMGIGLGEVSLRLERRLEARKLKLAVYMPSLLVGLIGCVPVLETRFRGDVPLPLASQSIVPLEAGRFLANDPEAQAVIELPQLFDDGRRGRDAILLMQVAHEHKSSSLPLDRISTFVTGARQMLRSNPLIKSLVVLAGQNGPDERMCCQQLESYDPFVTLERSKLVALGFNRLILTYRDLPPAAGQEIKGFCRKYFGEPIFVSQQQEVYRISRDLTP